jgi:energy-converting hydrogenase Eha subunit C
MIAETSPEGPVRGSPLGAFVALAGLTAGELAVATAAGVRAVAIAALSCLLLAKVALVLTAFMGVRRSRRTARLVLVALVLAVGFAAALMADTAFRARHG